MAEHSHPNVSNLLMCTHVLTCFIFPIYLHFSKCIFVRQCAPLLRMYICAPMCPISPMCPTFANVYLCPNVTHFPNVPHFCECIFVPQCDPLLQMYICAPLCPTSLLCPTFTNIYLCPNVPHFYKCIFVPQCAPMCPTFAYLYMNLTHLP